MESILRKDGLVVGGGHLDSGEATKAVAELPTGAPEGQELALALTTDANKATYAVIKQSGVVELMNAPADDSIADSIFQRLILRTRLSDYLQSIGFVDTNITRANMARIVREATENPGTSVDGVSPIPSDVGMRIAVLNKLANDPLSISKKAIAVNIGGTNTEVVSARFEGGNAKGIIQFKRRFRDNNEEMGPIKCDNHIDYWRRTVPVRLLDSLRDLKDNGELAQVNIGLGVATPTENGKIVHMSDKATFISDPLAPQNADDSSTADYPLVVDSFLQFLEMEGISIAKDHIHLSENDTVAIVLGVPEIAKNRFEKGMGIGGVVVGTGFNVCVFGSDGKGFNLEIGHANTDGSQVDQLANGGFPFDLEGAVSGKNLWRTLQVAIDRLTPEESLLSSYIQSLNGNMLNSLIFSLGSGVEDESSLGANAGLNRKEIILLSELCRALVNRAALYLAETLQGICDAMSEEIEFIGEGSVIDRNPKFVKMVNEIAGSPILKAHNDLKDTNPEGTNASAPSSEVLSASAPSSDKLTPSTLGSLHNAIALSSITTDEAVS